MPRMSTSATVWALTRGPPFRREGRRRPEGAPNRVRRAWMLADRAEAQPRNGPEEESLDHDDEREGHPDDRVLVADDVADEGDRSDRAERHVGDSGEVGGGAGVSVELVVEVARQSEREDVERHPGDDLVAAEVDRRDRVDGYEDPAYAHGDRKSQHDTMGPIGSDDAEERSNEHAALERDVHHTGALRDHPAERREEDRRGEAKRGREHACADDLIERHVIASMGFGPRRRAARMRTMSSAAMTKSTSASITETSCAETPASACMIGPPRAHAPESRAARRVA